MTGAGGVSAPTVRTDIGPDDLESGPLESPKYYISPVQPGVYVVNSPEAPSNSNKQKHTNKINENNKAKHEVFNIDDDIQLRPSNGNTGNQDIDGSNRDIDRSQTFGVDENEARGNWTGRLDFILSLLGYAVGLGNLWRFPYLCYRNGGGAFLVPYLIFMSIVGIPLFFLETSLAQYSSCGPTTCWGFSPIFSGLGIAMCMVSGLTSLYYNMIIAWCMFYFFVSFQHPLPWAGCDNDWNTEGDYANTRCPGTVVITTGTQQEGDYANIRCPGTAVITTGTQQEGDYANTRCPGTVVITTGTQQEGDYANTRCPGTVVITTGTQQEGDYANTRCPGTVVITTGTQQEGDYANIRCPGTAVITTGTQQEGDYANTRCPGTAVITTETQNVDCRLKLPSVSCDDGVKHVNGTCYVDSAFTGLWNDSLFTEATGRKRVSPSEEYYNGYILGISSGVEEVGQPRWQLTLILLAAWTICFLCLIRGIKTTGKVVYVTAIFPYIMLLILFFRGVTLDNAGEGIKFYILPKFEMDSLFVSLGNCMTSIFGGFVIFSYIGFMAGQLGVTVDKVATDGAGLVFVIYPEALNNLPGSTFWAIIFFLMLITLGLDSQFVTVETVMTGLCDSFPGLRKYKTPIIGALCFFSFLLGLPMCTPGGVYILQILDYYVAGWSLLFIGLTEVLAVTYVYGCRRFCDDIELMIGRPPALFWKVTWMATCPIGIAFILVFAWVDYAAVTYGDYVYPGWVDGVGWLLALVSVIWIPGLFKSTSAGYSYRLPLHCNYDNYLLHKQKLRLITVPSREWGPALVKHRRLVERVPGFVVDPFTEKGQLNRAYSGSSLGSIHIANGNSVRRYPSGTSMVGSTRSLSTGRSGVSATSRVTYESQI
ncbi:SC6A5-like protein [Mya arenaria]|uniref:Transporter n=1 Tax=Mya arenaria TaxID=6604 RepID=A0ABY7FRY2_MYAAR|nr:SC6A5-like protein [Mya arenaria]